MSFGYIEINVRCQHCNGLLQCDLRGNNLVVDTHCEGCKEIEDQQKTDDGIVYPSVVHSFNGVKYIPGR